MEQRRQKRNGLMFGLKTKTGFSLLELLIVIAIIGVLGSIIMPNMRRVAPRYEREEFIARFNALTQLGWQQALMHNKLQQIMVDVGKRRIALLAATGEKSRVGGEPVFKPDTSLAQSTVLVIPDQINIKQFFIEGYDMMAKFTTSKTEEVWFYIIPEGMAQDVVVNFVDTKDTKDEAPRPVGLVLNPFTAQFKVYDAFQKP
jgi:prepilin-type N-terminal cleavage/methylation domain-containing protein